MVHDPKGFVPTGVHLERLAGRLREDSSFPRSEHLGFSENRLLIVLNDLPMLIIIAPLVPTIGLLTVLNGIIIITPLDKVIYIYIIISQL